jgi:hypothetical protein
MKNSRIIMGLVAGFTFLASMVGAAEPGRLGVVVARGELRKQIESTPILERPYRPLHFYGNAVRRAHYRGSALAIRPGRGRG